MELRKLFEELIHVFDGARDIEALSREALRIALDDAERVHIEDGAASLRTPFLDVMGSVDAYPICDLIGAIPFQWAPPTTSNDPQYIAHSLSKSHVEILGPNGLVRSDRVRMGLYGMMPNAEYGIRTHPAEEIYVMLAGRAFWLVGDKPYIEHGVGDRSFHPSMWEHSTKTGASAFMSVYVWSGDLSMDGYAYAGLPEA